MIGDKTTEMLQSGFNFIRFSCVFETPSYTESMTFKFTGGKDDVLEAVLASRSKAHGHTVEPEFKNPEELHFVLRLQPGEN